MAKRRSSVKGRGSEILFGDPQAVKVAPLASHPDLAVADALEPVAPGQEPTLDRLAQTAAVPSPSPPVEPAAEPEEVEPSAEPEKAEVDAGLDEAELLAGLSEEARDAESGPEEQGEPVVQEQPVEPVVPAEQEQPVVPVVQEQPVKPVVQEQPVEPVVQEQPVMPAEQEQPVVPAEQEPPDTQPSPTPEMEHAFGSEAVVAEEPPAPVVEAPSPTLEVTMEEKAKNEDMAIHEPPPPETSDVAGDVLPPRPARRVFSLVDAESIAAGADIQSSDAKEKPFELPDRELTDEEQKKLLARLGSARIRELDDEITKAYDQVLSRIGENEELTTECFNQLLKARDILFQREAARIPQAEYYVEQVRARLKRAAESQTGAKKYAWWIAGWGLFWFLIFLGVLIALNYSWFQSRVVPGTAANTPVDMVIFLPAMVWGGIGGVAAVFYSLFKHVGRRDFDTQYNLSYVGKPFLGVILGATVYMIIHLMIMTLGILPVGLAPSGGTVQTPTVAPWIIYLLAWACGFKENRIFDLVDRVMKQLFTGGEAANPPAPSMPAS